MTLYREKMRRAREWLRYRNSRSRTNNRRKAFTLVETALAMAIAAIMLVTVTATIADGERLLLEADRLSLALSVAQAKMTQLTSGIGLEVTNEAGRFDDRAGPYAGFAYTIEVREEQIDLAQVAETGTISSAPPLEDQLPAGVQNQELQEKAGSSASSVTGGLVDVYRVSVEITYPRGISGEKGTYNLVTYRENKK